MSRYVKVTITRSTKAVSQAGFGLPLILATDKEAAYKEYAGDTALASIGTDFGTDSDTYKVANAILGQKPRPEKVAVYGILYDGVTPADLSTALNTLQLEHDDWFYVTSAEQGDAEVTELSTWANAQEKMYFASTSNDALATTLNGDNTVVLVHDDLTEYPAEAWVGYGASQAVGSFTWTFKTLQGVTPAQFDETKLSTIEDNNGNAYIREGGVNITSNGVATSGEYIDIIQGEYFIKARMTEAIFGLLVREPKVPYSTKGINQIVAEVEGVLKRAANQDIVAKNVDDVPQFTVTAPSLADISTNDKAARKLTNLKWTAVIAGAIEDVEIQGELTL